MKTEPVTLVEVMSSLVPRLQEVGTSECPHWPPDVFAIAASLLERSGAYVRAIQMPEISLAGEWATTVKDAPKAWRAAVTAVPPQALPPAVLHEWATLLRPDVRALSLRNLRDSNDTAAADARRALMRLTILADEACRHIATGAFKGPTGEAVGEEQEDKFEFIALRLLYPDWKDATVSSLGFEVDASRARVLPKQHVPQSGLTIRSFSHYLALVPLSEVDAHWLHACIPKGSSSVVNALLMDGPQVKGRWSDRYANGLADDPGCSVLTLTSLGMVERANAFRGRFPESRAVAMWREAGKDARFLDLPEGAHGLLLSITRRLDEELTADGRGDGRTACFPSLTNVFPLSLDK